MNARLIDGVDLSEEGFSPAGAQIEDPSFDEELSEYATKSGATHLCTETGYYYKLDENLDVSFFRRDSAGVISQIPSSFEAFELDHSGFIPFASGGSSMDRALRSIANYWKLTGPHIGAILLCGASGTGKTWLSSELNKQGLKNHESCSLYGLGAGDAKKAFSIIKKELAYHDSEKTGHLIFSTTSLELANALDLSVQVFFLEGSPAKAIRISLAN